MDRIPVVSNNVASVGYDERTATLEIEFLKGGIYQYFAVPKELYEELMASSSKGSFISARIRAAFTYAKVG